MAGTCSWQIMRLDCSPEFDGKQNVVVKVYWRRYITDGVYSSDTYGAQDISWSLDNPFTPYDRLTNAQVERWLEIAIGLDKIAELDSTLNRQIDSIKNPSVVSPALPWA